MLLNKRLVLFQQLVRPATACLSPWSPGQRRTTTTTTTTRSGVAYTNHWRTAYTLQMKNVLYQCVPRETPPDVAKVWANVQATLGCCDGNRIVALPLAQDALDILKKPLMAEYDNETDFNQAMFEALRKCWSACELEQETNDSNTILLNLGTTTNAYAVGLARHVVVSSDLHAEMGEPTTCLGDTDSGKRVKSMLDHAVCLFQKDQDSQWRVKDIFSAVELKMSDASCSDFRLVSNKVFDIALDREHGALGQVITYNLGCVLPFHARRGLLNDYLPLAILAGKRTSTWTSQIKVSARDEEEEDNNERAIRLRWVSGTLEIPETCGGICDYSVKDFGYFFDSRDEKEDQSVNNALSLYLDTVLFGLKRAIRVHTDILNNTMPLPVATSGRVLTMGGVPIDLPIYASPIPGANRVGAHDDDEFWRISQGELFAGKLRVNKELWRLEAEYADFLDDVDDDDEPSREVDVVVKVSSPTVHRLLIHPELSFRALKKARRAKNELAREIGTVLFAAIRTENGMVTIMEDLSKQGYQSLKPEEQSDKLAVLWAGFSEVVKRVLLPLAEMEIVHPDIRPGFDVTSNVLCKFDDDNKATMKLIDYESLVDVSDWLAPVRDGRYIKSNHNWNATTFVWWQCVCLAYTWHNKLDTIVLRQGLHFLALMDDFEGQPKWFGGRSLALVHPTQWIRSAWKTF